MKNLENNELEEKEKKELEEIYKGLAELDQLQSNINAQRKLLNNMLGVSDDDLTMTEQIVLAIDNYIEDKNIAYRVDDDESNETVKILKIINADTNSTAVVKIINMDWM